MAATAVNIPALYGALDQQRQMRSLTWRELAKSLRLSPSTFTRMAQGNRPDADAFLTLVAWLGVSAETFAIESPGALPREEVEPLTAITSFLRGSPKVTADEAEALSGVIAAAYSAIVKEK